MTKGIGIGSTIWIFSENRRVYAKDGRGGPIWREHWVPHVIEGETRRSWIVQWGRKIPKKPTEIEMIGIAYSKEQIDEAEFVETHRYKISQDVLYCRDSKKLRQIAEIIGYKNRP